MIAELFWPKEMKELVKKYRDEGTLNEEAVRGFNKGIHQSGAIIGLLFFFLLLGFGVSFFYSSILLILIMITSGFLQATDMSRKYVIPYTIGNKERAKLRFFKKDPFGKDAIYGKFFLGYEYNKKPFTLKHVTKEEKHFLETQGVEFEILINPRNEKYNIPYFQEWNKKYNLNNKNKEE